MGKNRDPSIASPFLHSETRAELQVGAPRPVRPRAAEPGGGPWWHPVRAASRAAARSPAPSTPLPSRVGETRASCPAGVSPPVCLLVGGRGGGKISIRDAPGEKRGWRGGGCANVAGGSNQSISSQSDGETTGSWISSRWSRSRWVVRVGGRCVEPKLHPQLSVSPPPPPLLSSVIHLPYSLGYAVLVTLYQWAPAGVTLRFLPGWARRHFSAPWRISPELNPTPWCWNKQMHPPNFYLPTVVGCFEIIWHYTSHLLPPKHGYK